jgi:hypothetical protein
MSACYDADQGAKVERREHPPVQPDIAKVILNDWHNSANRHGLKGNDGDKANNSGQQKAVLRIPN